MKLTRLQIFLVIVGALVLGLAGWWWLTPEPVRVRPANVGTHSFSVGWFTERPTKGCVLAASSFRYQDWVRGCDQRKDWVHLVDVKGVESGNSYYLILIDFPRITWQRIVPVTTMKVSEKPPQLPEPAFGGVIDQDQSPVEGALVYIEARSLEFSYPVAAVTNEAGNYAVDMGPNVFKAETFFLDAVSSGGVWAEKMISKKFKTPVPTIIVRTE